MQPSASAKTSPQGEEQDEAGRLVVGLRKWARASFNQEMQRVLLAAADWIEAKAKA